MPECTLVHCIASCRLAVANEVCRASKQRRMRTRVWDVKCLFETRWQRKRVAQHTLKFPAHLSHHMCHMTDACAGEMAMTQTCQHVLLFTAETNSATSLEGVCTVAVNPHTSSHRHTQYSTTHAQPCIAPLGTALERHGTSQHLTVRHPPRCRAGRCI